MKNRAKMISLLIAVCMMITLLPAVALAAQATSVNIGNKTLNSEFPYYVNGENGDGAVGKVYKKVEDIPDGKEWNAKFENGTLTLKNLNIVNVRQGQENDGIRGIRWRWSDLTIVLQGENVVTNTRGAAIVCDTGGSLTLEGNGILYATGATSGIWVWDNITIGGNVKVYATGVTKYGIANNEKYGTTITIKDNAQVIADGSRGDSDKNGLRYGIGCENDDNTNIKIEGNSSLTAFGVDGAIQCGIDSCYKSSIAAATNVNGNGATVIASSDVNDTHKYIAVNKALTLPRYYVFFDRNVNPTAPNPNAPAMTAQSVASGSLTLNNYSDGTNFNQWNTESNGYGTAYDNQAVVTPVRSMILYAQKTAKPIFNVTFNAGEGDGTMAAASGVSGDYLLPHNGFTAPSGKVFDYWQVGSGSGSEIKAEGDAINVSDNVTVTAIWKAAPATCTVKFDDGNGGAGLMSDVTVEKDTAYILPDNGFPPPADQKFNFWAVNSSSTHNPGDVITVAADTTVSARWRYPYKYAVRFNPNATVGSYTGSMALQEGFIEDVPMAITKNAFELDGYTFTGWKDEYGNLYDDEATITLTAKMMVNDSGKPDEILNLYAQWKENNTGGGTGGGNTGGGSNTGGSNPGGGNPGTTIPTVDASSGISLWYNGGNSFGSSNSAVPTSVEIDGVPVSFNGDGREFTVGCISPNAKWVTANWNSTSVTTNFTPDANATCAEITLPKTGDVSVMAFALMAVVAAAGAMGKK